MIDPAPPPTEIDQTLTTQATDITPQDHWSNIQQGFIDEGFEPYEIAPLTDQTTAVVGIWDKDPHSYPNGTGGLYTVNPGDYMIQFFTGEIRPVSPDVFGAMYEVVTDTGGNPVQPPPNFGKPPNSNQQ